MGRLQVKVVGTGDSCTVENKKASVKMKDRASAGGGDDKTLGGVLVWVLAEKISKLVSGFIEIQLVQTQIMKSCYKSKST